MGSKEQDLALNPHLPSPIPIVSLDSSSALPHPPHPPHDPLPLPRLTSTGSDTSTAMGSMHVPSYGQSLPGIGQPYSPSAPHPNHPDTAHEPQSSNQYPQYSYDIQLRSPDLGRAYEQPHYSGPPRIALPPMSAMTTMEDQGAYSAAPPFSDSTGQVAPPGAKPRVTATLWEDEGTLCFQVDVNGTCVARREDNHMINGTKLLNVAGMTRGRRDGILKSEKLKHVVKIGPMHLKGVWIPFERALEFANKEKITESLYPLFVHNIGALLYHPSNHHAHALHTAARGIVLPRNGGEAADPNHNHPNHQNQNQAATFYGAAPPAQGGEHRSIYS